MPKKEPSIFTTEQFVAHRGYTARYPENTLLAIKQAIVAGATQVELDIQLSKDKVPIIYHDASLKRISGIKGKIFDYNADELSRMPAHAPGSFKDTFLDNTINRANELIPLALSNKGVHFYIELKEESIDYFTAATCLQVLRQTLEPIIAQCTLISFDHDATRMARSEFGFQSTGIVTRQWQQRNEQIEASQANIAYINIKRIPAQETIKATCPLVVYEIADPELARETLERGASKIETYDIGKLINALCKNMTSSL